LGQLKNPNKGQNSNFIASSVIFAKAGSHVSQQLTGCPPARAEQWLWIQLVIRQFFNKLILFALTWCNNCKISIVDVNKLKRCALAIKPAAVTYIIATKALIDENKAMCYYEPLPLR